MLLSCSDLNFNTVVLHNLFLCFVVALKTHLANGFFAPTKKIVKSIGIEYCNTFVKKVLVLLLPILFCPSICIGIGYTFGKYC